MQPSSAVLERFFSVIIGNSTAKQNREAVDTLQGRSMALYNERKTEEMAEAAARVASQAAVLAQRR